MVTESVPDGATQITFRNMESSQSLEAEIHRQVASLARYHRRIVDCSVLVETHHHQQRKAMFHVRITLRVPGEEVVVSRDSQEAQRNENPYVAVHDAFRTMHRHLEEAARRHRHSQRAREDVSGHIE